MELYEVIILCIINLLSFIVGAKIGQTSAKGKDITLNPVKAVKEDIKQGKIKKSETLRKRQLDTMLNNIDNFDGSGLGQTKIPRN